MAKRTIALLGSGTTLRHAPFNDRRVEMWGLAYAWGKVPRLDVCFELHHELVCRGEGIWSQLQTITAPIYMQRTYPDIPTSRPYPLDAVAARFDLPNRIKPYLCSTPSFMLALALLEPPYPDEIQLHGFDMAIDEEYAYQLPSCEFFLGIAVGLGVRVVVPRASDLLKTKFLYAYEDDQRLAHSNDVREKLSWYRLRHVQAETAEQDARDRRNQLHGAIVDLERDLRRNKDR